MTVEFVDHGQWLHHGVFFELLQVSQELFLDDGFTEPLFSNRTVLKHGRRYSGPQFFLPSLRKWIGFGLRLPVLLIHLISSDSSTLLSLPPNSDTHVFSLSG